MAKENVSMTAQEAINMLSNAVVSLGKQTGALSELINLQEKQLELHKRRIKALEKHLGMTLNDIE